MFRPNLPSFFKLIVLREQINLSYNLPKINRCPKMLGSKTKSNFMFFFLIIKPLILFSSGLYILVLPRMILLNGVVLVDGPNFLGLTSPGWIIIFEAFFCLALSSLLMVWAAFSVKNLLIKIYDKGNVEK